MEILSLCMIVKNEEEQIEKCLQSVVDVVDEVIIVDTGSNDRTKEICQAYKAKVYDFPWDGSFASARNFGIRQAKAKWIFWMDADEELEIFDRQSWEDALNCKKQLMWAVPILNYIGEYPVDTVKAYHHVQWRIFRNGLGVKFVNNIHEQLDISDIRVSPENIKKLPAVIHHYGYMNAIVEKKDKHQRNLTMLRKEAEQPVYSAWIDYHLASEYYRNKEYYKTFDQLNIAIRHFIQEGKIPPSLVYKLKYDTLLATGSFDGALAGIDKAIELYTDYVDLHYYKGILLYEKRHFSQARESFLHCLSLGEENPQYLILNGVGSFHAMYMIALCDMELNQQERAKNMFERILELYPHYSAALQKLEEMRGQ